MTDGFELFLFTTSVPIVEAAAEAGIDGIVVDWEHHGKYERQRDFDTQINRDTPEDLRRVRRATGARVLCRVNHGPTTAREIEQAIDGGADEILLPMVRHPREVETALAQVRGRCGLGILVETADAVGAAPALGALPIARAYVGLNDLAIDRQSPGIFAAVADGTVQSVRPHFSAPFGFGGLTLPDRGRPVPCRLLISEMARLQCSFSFLRRSFLRDVRLDAFPAALTRIRQALCDATRRPPVDVRRDRAALEAAVLVPS